MNQYIDKQEMMQVFFSCTMKDPQGIYLDLSADFDLVEYTNKLIETIESRVAKVERDFCIEFVRSLNTEVANALEEKRGNL